MNDNYKQRMEEVFLSNTKQTKTLKQTKQTKQSKKKIKKKGKQMSIYGDFATGSMLSSTVAANLLTGDDVVNIKLSQSKRNRGYIFYMQKDLQTIYEKSGPHAYDNEFQVHYWFLNFRYQAEDKSIIDIAIPTCYFNYEQFVTGGHVDFELKDVGPISDKLLPVHNMKVNELIAMDIQNKIEAIFQNKLKFEAISVNLGTMHRHPGQSASQSFSSTDLNINVKTEQHALGVVFPLAEAEDDKPSFSAIIALDSDTGGYSWQNNVKSKKIANLAHCEYRNANGKIQTGLHYEKNRCIAFNVMPSERPSDVEMMFGAKPTRRSITKFSNTESTLFEPEIKLLEIFEELEATWEASTHLVIPENVKLPARAEYLEPARIKRQYPFGHYYYDEDEFGYAINSKSEEKNTKQSVSKTAIKTLNKHDEYLYAKQELSKIKFNEEFQKSVVKYLAIENEQNFLNSLPVAYATLKFLIDDYNKMSKIFNSKNHKKEDIEFYVVNATVDFRDIKDFLNENIMIAQAVLEEVITNIEFIKAYEDADRDNPLRSVTLYINPFQNFVKPVEEKKDEVKVEEDKTETKEPDEIAVQPVEQQTTIHQEEKPNHILSAVAKFMRG